MIEKNDMGEGRVDEELDRRSARRGEEARGRRFRADRPRGEERHQRSTVGARQRRQRCRSAGGNRLRTQFSTGGVASTFSLRALMVLDGTRRYPAGETPAPPNRLEPSIVGQAIRLHSSGLTFPYQREFARRSRHPHRRHGATCRLSRRALTPQNTSIAWRPSENADMAASCSCANRPILAFVDVLRRRQSAWPT